MIPKYELCDPILRNTHFKGFNDIPEQKPSDGELLDDVPVSFQMN